MNRIARLFSHTDPARHLKPTLDQRAESELAALMAAQNLPARAPVTTATNREQRFRPHLVTGLVALAVVGSSAAVILAAPAHRDSGIGSRTLGLPVQSPPQSSPSAASPAPSSTEGEDSPTRLIGPDGSRRITREQLHTFAQSALPSDDPRNAVLWEQQQRLAIRCMADAGYLFDPTLGVSKTTSQPDGLTDAQRDDYYDTLGGKGASTPYTWRIEADWRTAGCMGRAVHLTDPGITR